MGRYKLFFEFYGKKMVAEIEAQSKYEAEEIIRNKINFHKTVIINKPVNNPIYKDFNFPDELKGFLGL